MMNKSSQQYRAGALLDFVQANFTLELPGAIRNPFTKDIETLEIFKSGGMHATTPGLLLSQGCARAWPSWQKSASTTPSWRFLSL